MPLLASSRRALIRILTAGFLGLLFGLIPPSTTYAVPPPPELDWLELMPLEDQQALDAMPDITHTTPEGQGFSDQKQLKQLKGLPAVMYSTKTVAALNGKNVRLGGYVVPLTTTNKGMITEFFLVPYPGACVHVPPPPPNQIVLIHYPAGLTLEDPYTPVWVDGPLNIQKTANALAEAAYRINANHIQPIGEEGF